ncbi:hypothetical protein CK203_055242 [Vitis vinifera]|uniref:Uncharacterized protein n=1 Tax=Vitis vinifera TaxID=29760 RepID=A0A438GTV8_VITVI|nr:hypothetical protein CK203_055242 [Vitis vinifera]
MLPDMMMETTIHHTWHALLNNVILPFKNIILLINNVILLRHIPHRATLLLNILLHLDNQCRDPSPWETRGTQLMVTRGTCYQPDHHHPDSPKDMHSAVILSGPPQGKANDVSASPIQGRANDAGRA